MSERGVHFILQRPQATSNPQALVAPRTCDGMCYGCMENVPACRAETVDINVAIQMVELMKYACSTSCNHATRGRTANGIQGAAKRQLRSPLSAAHGAATSCRCRGAPGSTGRRCRSMSPVKPLRRCSGTACDCWATAQYTLPSPSCSTPFCGCVQPHNTCTLVA
jgi:hypothetical protein